MSTQSTPDFNSLENNIIDVIKEEQIKLGYRRETVRLYYPVDSLNNLLGFNQPLKELKSILGQFCLYAKKHLGEVEYSCENSRFCIVIPPVGVSYVHDEVEDRYFLREFIEKISEPDNKIEDILSVFYKYSDNVTCNKMTKGEFDYLIYFKEGMPDAYRYCIKFEECHIIYHRFTKSDYESFGF